MKFRHIITASLLIAALAGVTACSNPFSAKQETNQQFEVTRGDITVNVNGNGKTGVATDAKLSFGSGGKIEALNVKKGDLVKKGAILARLETGDLELAKSQAQVALAQAQVAVTQTRLAQQTAELALAKTGDYRSTLELALFNAQVSRKTAEIALSRSEETAPAPDIVAAKAAVDRAESYLQYALDSRNTARDTTVWDKVVERAQVDLDVAQTELDRLTDGSDPDDIAIKKMQLESAEKTVLQAQKSLDDLGRDIAMEEAEVASAKEVAAQAQRSAELAQLVLNQAQKRLNEVTIVAPWDGLVITVDAREGDVIALPAAGAKPVIYLLDPASMEVNAEIDEIDIASVKLNQRAVISLDAAPGVQFSGKVTSISMVPVQKQAGVVAYEVKIGIDTMPEIQLRVGMSATVDIAVNARQNVLLIPNRAIKYDNMKQPVVEVTTDKKTEKLPVVLGLSDGVNTEVVSGLESGTMVVAAQVNGKRG